MYSESLRAFLKPVLPFLDDESVTEIMINGPTDVWIERKGKLFKTEATFSEEGLLGAARNMAQFVGRPLSDERPRLDARLPDGSRIHVVLPPMAKSGTTISIRKFFRQRPTIDALLGFGSITPPMAKLLDAAIITKANMVVAGGTGSGKTTLLNIVSSLIPDDERILTIEDSAELQLHQSHLVSFESRPPDKYGKGGVDMGDLLHSALRLRPDRIVVGEVRGGECFHLMQAMNTGHGGTLATTHANTPTDTLRRLESLCLMSAIELPMVAVRSQVASAIDLVVCCERLADGSRKVTHISEVLPLDERGEYRTQDLFVFTPVTRGDEDEVLGYHAPTGIIPTFVHRARAMGLTDLTDAFFDPATYGLPPPPTVHTGERVATRWAPSLKHREKGMPDPDDVQEMHQGLAERLREEHRKAKAAADQAQREQSALVPTSARAQRVPPGPRPTRSAAPAVPARPAPRAAAPARPPERRPAPPVDDDLTPPPTRSPLAREAPRRSPDGNTIAFSDELQADIESARGGEDEATAAGEHTAIKSIPEGFRRN